ncbi:MAG TPA: mechanosensitive ion channel [Flavilitoribacter sp.]|nr:mechanosensitive ion channel [Flavilitoribacter sp.]HMQ87844.1 mechanosensitive ion channel [Flavilitoribacter sp.]
MENQVAQTLNWVDKITEMVIEYAPKLGLALVLLFIGLRVCNWIARIAGKAMETAGISHNIVPFLRSLVGISLKVLLIFSVASLVGIDTASFLAVLAAAGFAVGLALQGSLSNFAAGIIILIFRPYKVGDWVEILDKFGKVEQIQIFNTIITTPGMKTLVIPNGQVVENVVTNYSQKGMIRLEVSVTMPYNESFPRVQEIIKGALETIPMVLKQPAPEVGIETFDTHNILLTVRPYVNPDDYWEATFEVHRAIKHAFHENKVNVAYSEGVEMGSIGQ